MNLKKFTFYFVIILLLITYILLIVLAFTNLSKVTKVDTTYISDVTIVIDAGHGGEDGGAVANGIVEKDINLSIANKLTDIFRSAGFKVVTTRDNDVMINTAGESLRERKVSDMKNRLSIYNSSDGNVVISIHQNMFSQEKYSGTQVFYSVNDPESQKLADYIKDSVVVLLQPDNKRETKAAARDIYLLYNATIPAVIVECGFISNYEESEKLKTEDYQNQIAFCIFSGFLEYYNNRG